MTHTSGRNYHFIGAGGIGMSGLAKVLLKQGAAVTGSDQEDTPVTQSLREAGAKIHGGHACENIQLPCDVVISAAIGPGNPELQVARSNGCKVYKYAQMLGELMDQMRGVAIAGTHGKSTTSGWLTWVMQKGGFSPNYIVGADIPQLGTSSGVGDVENGVFIAEACEYDRSFLNLHPQIGVVLNIEQDHLDYYSDVDDIIDAFSDFCGGVKAGGLVIANGDDENTLKMLGKLDPAVGVVKFGLSEACDVRAENIQLENGRYSFEIVQSCENVGQVSLAMPGRHNVMNALAVYAIAVNAGMQPGEVLEHLGDFQGMDRRLMVKYGGNGVTVMDDYAHHPTEIRASLQAMKQGYEPGRVICIFQPHQYSRTRFLLDDFAESFKLADITVVPDIYFVRDTEESRRLVNAQVLVDRIRSSGCDAYFIETFDEIVDYLKSTARDGDLIVTMGAGDIWKVADEYIQWLAGNSQN
ncbi:UDP-N-acetylmuramate--L-alanine ligase [Anaerohalosphaera lusitana]|uniref:UDP-N-acetylmuramate--L-alanine ligase n=1 Tax=Anaerohalosphaera lusitana TaxID=1936003 RepID=A0A1U9NRQ6_9BACT|nr:UDP-N-acetylmuramate--L-alanine ligase [Anaerohalosphaera lusitana]AQT70206.1 UDP-N-acetylmuramate--L-alanine ligase [Anaerohalosphaera lusitana]